MTIKLNLRAEAEAEAARIRAITTRPAADGTAWRLNGVAATVLRRATTAGLNRPAAIFFTRTRIADGTGRLVEDLVVPIEVRGCDVALQTQTLFERFHPLIRSACLHEVARRITDLASEYGRGLERACTRESQLARLAGTDRTALIQPGLFDGRAMKDRAPFEHDGRKEALDLASSLLVAQPSETVLLLVIGHAK
jgi:hypothetical protein